MSRPAKAAARSAPEVAPRPGTGGGDSAGLGGNASPLNGGDVALEVSSDLLPGVQPVFGIDPRKRRRV